MGQIVLCSNWSGKAASLVLDSPVWRGSEPYVCAACLPVEVQAKILHQAILYGPSEQTLRPDELGRLIQVNTCAQSSKLSAST